MTFFTIKQTAKIIQFFENNKNLNNLIYAKHLLRMLYNNINNVDEALLNQYIDRLNNRVQRTALAKCIYAELDWYILMNEYQGSILIVHVQHLYNELLNSRNINFNNDDQAFLNDFVNLFNHMGFDWLKEIQQMNLI